MREEQGRHAKWEEGGRTPQAVLLGTVVFLGAAVVLGALLAPPVFNIVTNWARAFPLLTPLRDTEFEKIASRCVVAAIVVGLIPALKAGGLLGAAGLGLRSHAWKQDLAKGWTLGSLMIVLFLAAGWACGAYRWSGIPWEGVAGRALAYVVGSFVVGFVEEPIFRGALYGVLRRGFRLAPAAMLASVIFAAVHFAAPDPPVGVVYGRWHSGLYLLAFLFTPSDLRRGFGFFFLALFAVGVVLCLTYERRRSLFAAIGMHAGWVWLMRLAQDCFVRESGNWPVLFGRSLMFAKSPAGVLAAWLLLGATVWRFQSDRKPGTSEAGE